MAYNVVLRRNGAKVGHFGPFGTKKQAIAQGQVLADDAARDVVVSVEPQRKKATTKRKNTRKNTDPKPRVKPYTKSLSIGEDKADAREKAWLKKSYTVFLGSTVFSNGGGFDYWGNPATGRVIAVGVKGYSSSGFGDAGYWAAHVSRKPDVQTTEEGRNWNWRRFRTNTRRTRKKELSFPNSNLYLVGMGKDANGNSVIKLKYPNSRAFSIQLVGTDLHALFRGKRSITGDERPSWTEKVEKEVIYHIRNFGSLGQKQGLRVYGAGGDYSTSPEKLGWRTNTRRSNPSRGKFKAQKYKYYRISGSGGPHIVDGRNSLKGLNAAQKKKYDTAQTAKETIGYSLTSSYAWMTNRERWAANEEATKRRKLRPNKSKDWITREGKLGGPGYSDKPVRTRHALLNKAVKGYGYRSTLGSLMVLLRNSHMGAKDRKVITADKNWLKAKYGGEGSFGPQKKRRKNPASKSILKRIDLANKWIEFAKKERIWGSGYFGSTWPVSIKYTHKITVTPQKNRATVRYTDTAQKAKHSESYNLNDTDTYSDTGVSALRHEINTYIIKAIKNGAKDDGIKIPASLR